MKFFILLFLLFFQSHALSFSFIKHESSSQDGPTLLVIGGIHGNEPGSYFATSILSQYYTIQSGHLWIVPNLNKLSIAMDNRGVNGDMNRKFAEINSSDPDYTVVKEIQNIITEPKVDLILNLHDGHGFYRKEYKNTIFNPASWGQTCVIDQTTLDCDHPYKDLNKIALAVREELNDGLIEDYHSFDIRNTNTRFDDEAMKHSLTYFAINHNKPAFAIETSKNLPTLPEKVFYQLRAIEAYMRFLGITYTRTFNLTTENLINLLKKSETVTINNTFILNLDNINNNLSYIPLQSDLNHFDFSHPLGLAVKNKDKFDLYIGNKKVTTLSQSIHEVAKCDEKIVLEIDKKQKNVVFATEFFVTADFKVIIQNKDIRVNIIGYTPKSGNDEANANVSIGDLDPKYSIDQNHKVYRVEFYRGNRFCGMVLAHFK
ncbi:MAG: M99 family carboxypeptidase catalytic domain-containing protein [Sulfuricurvum sp.]|uniref:M99 family carboxypeptidase catalytic domain-containing protein n=1 Tax=Sulfuricurvum sp. TaxID=2025608 RepID=UPI0026356ABA|nr:M99 family carboxypeptidase catalytic domain-containing protein [Sulfuricurvum sp.]MDD2828917.1 M99 family carboxypeptidase catalytic domain-containing protein [Sulfuricurvum sp.]MDD4948580.1 M99 family carboxypeptidase catalytic domain-containing protein [Sulfuricurvum sp.]